MPNQARRSLSRPGRQSGARLEEVRRTRRRRSRRRSVRDGSRLRSAGTEPATSADVRASKMRTGFVKMRLRVDVPRRELSSSTVPGVCFYEASRAQAERDAMHSCIRSVARYCVTVSSDGRAVGGCGNAVAGLRRDGHGVGARRCRQVIRRTMVVVVVERRAGSGTEHRNKRRQGRAAQGG